jgi:hypothetical protein
VNAATVVPVPNEEASSVSRTMTVAAETATSAKQITWHAHMRMLTSARVQLQPYLGRQSNVVRCVVLGDGVEELGLLRNSKFPSQRSRTNAAVEMNGIHMLRT